MAQGPDGPPDGQGPGGEGGPGGRQGGPGGFGQGRGPRAGSAVKEAANSAATCRSPWAPVPGRRPQCGHDCYSIPVRRHAANPRYCLTKVATQMTISASDLKVGNQVQVQGVPTAITATSLTAGQSPDFLPAAEVRDPVNSAARTAAQAVLDGRGGRGGPGGPGGSSPTTLTPADHPRHSPTRPARSRRWSRSRLRSAATFPSSSNSDPTPS